MRRALVITGILLRTGFRGLEASRGTTGVAVFTISLALVLMGSFLLLVQNMQGMLDEVGDEIHVTAFLASEVEEPRRKLLLTAAVAIEGVQSALFVSADAALEKFRASSGGAELLEGIEVNPLPASLEISLAPEYRDPVSLERVAEAVAALPDVEELAYGQEWVEAYSRAVSLVRTASWVLGIVLALAALLICANTIRLAIYAREDELEILALVGASGTFIRVPFVIEGIVQGTGGGVLALGVLYLAFSLLLPGFGGGLELLIGNATPQFFSIGHSVFLVFAGASLGGFGSLVALVGWRR